MTTSRRLSLDVNGEAHVVEVEPQETLLHVLRERLGLTGTKANCEEGECGACTVLVDGLPVNSCLLLAVRAQGKSILTIEGLAKDGRHERLLTTFANEGAIQCGYCSPGFLMSSAALLAAHPSPTRAEIVDALSGNICRCTGYTKIVKAVFLAAGSEVAPQSDRKAVGRRTPRQDTQAKASGAYDYGMDFRIEGQLYGAILRSPHPHALIRSSTQARLAPWKGSRRF
jgi:aerobic-type carbon monoxide dehydrogenase small subunit (CoxS/CutS family)